MSSNLVLRQKTAFAVVGVIGMQEFRLEPCMKDDNRNILTGRHEFGIPIQQNIREISTTIGSLICAERFSFFPTLKLHGWF